MKFQRDQQPLDQVSAHNQDFDQHEEEHPEAAASHSEKPEESKEPKASAQVASQKPKKSKNSVKKKVKIGHKKENQKYNDHQLSDAEIEANKLQILQQEMKLDIRRAISSSEFTTRDYWCNSCSDQPDFANNDKFRDHMIQVHSNHTFF